MKRKISLAIVLVLMIAAVLLVSCVPVAKYVCSDGKQVTDASKCTPTPAKDTDTNSNTAIGPVTDQKDEPLVVIKQISADAKTLMDKFSKVNSVQFNYFDSTSQTVQNTYYASRERMKIILETKAKFGEGNAYDTIYIDLVNKKAVAYCERASKDICKDRNQAFDVNYDLYVITTPFQWLEKVTGADLTGKSKMVDGRNINEMTFDINGDKGVMFIDSYYGAPVEITFKGSDYAFRTLVINEATSKDFVHQTLNNN
jgi:hypothetical protein